MRPSKPGDLRLRNGTEADLALIGGPSTDGFCSLPSPLQVAGLLLPSEPHTPLFSPLHAHNCPLPCHSELIPPIQAEKQDFHQ